MEVTPRISFPCQLHPGRAELPDVPWVRIFSSICCHQSLDKEQAPSAPLTLLLWEVWPHFPP